VTGSASFSTVFKDWQCQLLAQTRHSATAV
jgi:hypothetical protein